MPVERWPWYDGRLVQRGWVLVGARGELTIEVSDGYEGRAEHGPCGLAASDSVELALAILKQGKPTHRVVEREALGDAYERLRDIIEEDDDS